MTQRLTIFCHPVIPENFWTIAAQQTRIEDLLTEIANAKRRMEEVSPSMSRQIWSSQDD